MADDDDADDASAARDYVMARLLAAQVALQAGLDACNGAAALFVSPDDDAKGKERKEALEEIDACAGDAAIAIQLAMAEYDAVDPTEGEPDDTPEAPEPPPPRARRRRRS